MTYTITEATSKATSTAITEAAVPFDAPTASAPPSAEPAPDASALQAHANAHIHTRDKAAPQRSLIKGRQTRAAILDAALALASQMGLEGLSIGALAEITQMSKSGVFAHFGSREELQISVVRCYHANFADEVFGPAMRAARGLPRLRVLMDRWFKRVSVEIDAGCIYISGAVEFDDRPGPVRDALVGMVQTWHAALERAIRLSITEGHLRADTDPEQLLFEVHGLILALHHDARFLRRLGADARARAGFENVLSRYLFVLPLASPFASPLASSSASPPASSAVAVPATGEASLT